MKKKQSRAALDARHHHDVTNAKVAKTWKVKDGTCTLRQRPSGKWEAEFASDVDDRYTVTLASTPAKAIKRLRINTTPIAA